MNRKELITYCLTYADAIEDYPFEDRANTILRHKSNGKWFALVFEQDGKLCINLKCDPMEADFFRRAFEGVRPAWHMNKVHWNTVQVGSDVPEETFLAMIESSFALTAPKKTLKGNNHAAKGKSG